MAGSLTALVIASAILAAIPGPNVALIVANSLRHGFPHGLATVLGTSAGIALQLGLVALGLVAVVAAAAGVLSVVKWAGVAYLVYLGVRTWRAPPPAVREAAPRRTMFLRGAAIAALNPKTLLFNAAFLPQFLRTDATSTDIFFVAAVYLAVLAAVDCLWAAFASSARALLDRSAGIAQRLSGGFLVVAGLSLAAARTGED